MRISNEEKSRFIELSVLESVKENYPSYRVAISLETENIKSCFNNYIWISEVDIDNFILELESLDKIRKGQAELQSMSPGEFSLFLRAVDTFGHLSVKMRINNKNQIYKDYAYDVSIEFEVDPTILPSVIVDLKKIKK
jgi:hypothetical protein